MLTRFGRLKLFRQAKPISLDFIFFSIQNAPPLKCSVTGCWYRYFSLGWNWEEQSTPFWVLHGAFWRSAYLCSNSMGLWEGWGQYFSCFISLQLPASSTKSGDHFDLGSHFYKVEVYCTWWERATIKYKNFNWQVKTIFEFLKNGFHDISSSLDLSFEDDSVADEKIPFLAYLARILKENSFFPYEPPAGSKLFRNLIAGFMKTYHHVPLNADVRKLNYIC